MEKRLIESLIAEEYSQRYFDECQFVWQNYVPQRGRAKTLQGELLREIERIRCEAQDNGNVNWNNEYARYCDFISRSLTEQSMFSKNQKEIVIAIMAYIKDCGTYAKKYNDGEIDDSDVEPEKLAYTDDNLYDIICDFIGKLQKEHPEPIKL